MSVQAVTARRLEEAIKTPTIHHRMINIAAAGLVAVARVFTTRPRAHAAASAYALMRPQPSS